MKEKQSKKGGNIEYKSLEIAEYLQPTCEIENREKEIIFEIRNDMTNIPSNFGGECECLCGEKETMEHLYNCEHLSETKEMKIPFKEIYNGNIKKQIEVYRKFKKNLVQRNERMNNINTHVILNGSTVNPVTG